jgi:hypothetical protein
MKKLCLIPLLIFALLPLFFPPRIKPAGFSLDAVAQPLQEESHPFVSAELDLALSQPYTHLGNGGQCFAFLSADGNYVIKFIKKKAFDLPRWAAYLPAFIVQNKIAKREAKRNKVFSAFTLSYDNLRDETGLLYVHVNQTHDQKILNVEGNAIPLDDVSFVVQRRADLAFHRIDALMGSGNVEGAKEAIFQLLQLNLELYQKGFRNRDANFRSNCGFDGDKAILIDVGRIVPSDTVDIEKEIRRITPRFHRYLEQRHPELVPYFEQQVNACINF